MKKTDIIIKAALACLLCTSALPAWAQRHEILSPEIRSLQVVADRNWLGMPVITLGRDETVNISFDDMTHDYHRYTYAVEHCEADWTVSGGLFETDYIDGFYNGLTIDDYEESLNMATLYTHYRLRIPNDLCRLKLSGNYRLTVIDDDSREPVAKCCFMVLDRKFGVGVEMTTNTDIDVNKSHQQVNVRLQYNGVSVTDPESQVKGYVLQNNRWTTARKLPRAQFRTTEGMAWQHCRELIFPATNEYRKFEYLDLHRNSMGVDHTGFDGSNYHVWLHTDEPRPNYVHDEDANGAFYIRNTDNENNDTESEYFICHFTYKAPAPFNGEVYLNGQWTNDRTLPVYRMEYDGGQGLYHCAVRLKMGYYSYQYLLQNAGGTTVLPSEGNYWQTENRYACLFYYRPQGGRTDLLYGFGELSR
ncbi:MAG: DUF5103 domain-containing protein [Bacteroidales bacterium]|nr:DUF5103 domain-containing protein [Bacteroidales bacterium]MCM1147517.1 DUF5103 domain-containing protein [Bacteroidales bacterium]MCM1206186.1 DUF5103 domain-containing protein [Bacillota bacterium]MCM1509980.1 DUF5103 domain-containing protein [Clostridium sp.]